MSTRRPHILIVDSHSSANRGDAAILQALMDSLIKQIPNATFKVHSTYPKIAAAMHNVAANPLLIGRPRRQLEYLPMIVKICLFFLLGVCYRYGLDFTRWLPKRPMFATYKDFIEADLLVGMGGGFYNDNYSRSLPGRLFHLLLGKILRKPTVISAHSVGPFKRGLYRWMAQFVFQRLDLICLRDEESLAHLNLNKLVQTKIEVVADSAWLLQPASVERAIDILNFEGVPISKPLISIALIRWNLFRDKPWQEGHRQYVNAVAGVVNKLIESKNFHIVFLSTNTNFGGHPTDDRQTAREALALLKPALVEQTTIIEGEYHPEELQALYGQMRLHIGTRMHSVILAAGMKTPVVGIAYEFKMYGVMRGLGLGEYICDIETITVDDLWMKVSKALDRHEMLTETIAKSLPILQMKATRNARLIAQVFESRAAPPPKKLQKVYRNLK